MVSRPRTVAAIAYCLAIVIAIAAAAGAAIPARAAPGDPVVRVDTDEKADAARIRASIEIAAPPTVVWGVLTDCARSPKIIPNLESCRILNVDAGGRWDVHEHVVNRGMLMPKVRTVVRNTYDIDRRLQFKRVSGDMRISQGEWRLEPLSNARATRLHYDALVAPSFPVPQFLLEKTVREDIPKVLRAIQKASVEDAAKR